VESGPKRTIAAGQRRSDQWQTGTDDGVRAMDARGRHFQAGFARPIFSRSRERQVHRVIFAYVLGQTIGRATEPRLVFGHESACSRWRRCRTSGDGAPARVPLCVLDSGQAGGKSVDNRTTARSRVRRRARAGVREGLVGRQLLRRRHGNDRALHGSPQTVRRRRPTSRAANPRPGASCNVRLRS